MSHVLSNVPGVWGVIWEVPSKKIKIFPQPAWVSRKLLMIVYIKQLLIFCNSAGIAGSFDIITILIIGNTAADKPMMVGKNESKFMKLF